MAPPLVAGFCRCGCLRGQRLKMQHPLVPVNAAAAPWAWLCLSPGEQLGVWPHAQHCSCDLQPDSARMMGCSACPGDKPQDCVLSKGTLPEETCHPHWRPDSVRHQLSSMSLLCWWGGSSLRTPQRVLSLGCSARGAVQLSRRPGQQSPECCYYKPFT